MRKLRIALAVAALSSAAPVRAHEGPRIWIGNVNGRIITYTSDNDLNPTIYTPSRLFMTDFEPVLGIYTTDFPGYEVRQAGGNVASGTTFGFSITGPLLYFDEATQTFVTTQTEFGPPQPGPVPQIAVSLGSDVRATAGGAVSGFDFFTFNATGDHSHLSYTLLGDGSTASDGPAGVYALSMNLTGAALATSSTYYLLIGKNVEQTDPLFLSAVNVARATLVGPLGDMNCDGVLNAGDIAPFILAEVNPAAYATAQPTCSPLQGDMNQDAVLNGADIAPFVAALVQ